MVEIEEMAQLGSGTVRRVKSFKLSRAACMAISINADPKKPLVKAAKEFFMSKMDSKELAASVEGNVLIYRSTTGKVNVTVVFNNDNLWLSQKRMSDLYGVDVSTINYHLKQINDSGELQLSEAIRKIQIPSKKWDEQGVLLYNLDAIIAVGYRVNSYEATQFRIWARVVKSDVTIAKNYLSDKEIESLNLLTTAFLDMAEDRARRHIIMKMTDWITLLERYLQISDWDVLPDSGSISHEEAEAKALGEYEKFWRLQDKTFLSDFDKFIEGLEKD